MVISRKLGILVVLINVSLALQTKPLAAQSASSGSVSGQVSDSSGGAVTGAAVSVIDVTTNAARGTTTNDAGRYDFVNIPPGRYDLTVTKAGFSQGKVKSQEVQVGLALTLNVALPVGTTSTTVEVRRFLMRMLALVILAVGSASVAAPARAQTYDPSYPFCMQVVSVDGAYFDCSYTSMAQCAASASGRGAQCLINPFFARGKDRPTSKRTR